MEVVKPPASGSLSIDFPSGVAMSPRQKVTLPYQGTYGSQQDPSVPSAEIHQNTRPAQPLDAETTGTRASYT